MRILSLSFFNEAGRTAGDGNSYSHASYPVWGRRARGDGSRAVIEKMTMASE